MSKRRTAMVLAAVMVAVTVFTAIPAPVAQASYVDDFLNTVGPMCTIDMRDNHILASFTMAQAIWESGWGRSTLATQANNLFGIRAYSTWDGMVYDRNECVLYESWGDLVATKGNDYVKGHTNSFWRAYDSWQDSINDRSELFNRASIYENLRGNYDYKSCCLLVVEDGYCSDPDYTQSLINTIERYNLEQYNYNFDTDAPIGGGEDTTGGADSLTLNPATLYMEKGTSFDLGLTVTPNDATYSLTSSNNAVVSVSGNTVSSVGDGSATVTLKSGSLSVQCKVTVKSGYGCIVADGVYVKCVAGGTTATIPAEASTIKAGAFSGTNVDTIIVGQNVKSLEDGAFSGITGGFSLCSYGNSTVSSYAIANAISCVNVSVGWSLDKSAGILYGVSLYTTANLLSMYYGIEGVSATVKGENGTALSGTDYVGTNCTVSLGGSSYTVCIKGDANGDGIASASDLLKVKAYLSGDNDSLPTRSYRKAADYNNDERITTSDYLGICKACS